MKPVDLLTHINSYFLVMPGGALCSLCNDGAVKQRNRFLLMSLLQETLYSPELLRASDL